MRLEVLESIDRIAPARWNRLNGDDNPFLRHEFLSALERNQCVGPRYGWLPRHLALWHGAELVAAAPLYEKDNSYGEFVFDFSWADAFRRHGLGYYPKLVSAIPYTPAAGHRLLLADRPDRGQLAALLSRRAIDLAVDLGASSVHWLFLAAEDHELLGQRGLLERVGCQFHWTNPGYESFDGFLQALSSKRRKNIRRERRLVREQGIRLELRQGPEIEYAQWRLFARFYAKTFEERASLPTLNADFFAEVGNTLGRRSILVLAYHGQECVAGALLFRGGDTLYGRHWDCLRAYDSLHFEVCYYQGIEYCIQEGLRRFEPGAQGEHKIWRGFMPVLTHSRHWIRHPGFRRGIEDFAAREKKAVLGYVNALQESSPYRRPR